MDADVIVAGAGPTGLLTAYELALKGVNVIVVDKLPGRTGQSRALNLHPRTAEIFDLRGLLGDAEQQSRTRLESTHFAHMPVDVELDGWSSRYPYQVGIPQAEVEEILESHVTRLGVQIRWDAEVTDVVQDDVSVRVNIGDDWLEARYLVACDGGRSTIRKILGVKFPGLDARWFGTVADVVLGGIGDEINSTWDTKGTPRMRPDSSFANIFPIGVDGDPTFRIFYSVHGQEIGDPRAPVPANEVIEVIQDFYGTDTEVLHVKWASRFSDASRLVDKYRVERVFMAGDAAHVHLPLGGQGLNTGLQDAMNLGWKLAAVVSGVSPETILDSYHAERHPVGQAVMRNTRAQVALGQKSLEHEALRDLFADLMRLPQVNSYLGGAISGLSIRYGVDASSDVGSRFVDFRMKDGAWASSLFGGGNFVLLHRSNVLADLRVPPGVITAEVGDGASFDSEGILVRPDGHIAWSAAAGRFDDVVRQWISRGANELTEAT